MQSCAPEQSWVQLYGQDIRVLHALSMHPGIAYTRAKLAFMDSGMAALLQYTFGLLIDIAPVIWHEHCSSGTNISHISIAAC